MALNNYGSAISSLLPVVRAAAKKAHQDAFGTPRYFIERNLSIHRAFEAWCADQGLVQRAGEIRGALARHLDAYRTPDVLVLEPLFKTVPDEFNVRGRWTPELQ